MIKSYQIVGSPRDFLLNWQEGKKLNIGCLKKKKKVITFKFCYEKEDCRFIELKNALLYPRLSRDAVIVTTNGAI